MLNDTMNLSMLYEEILVYIINYTQYSLARPELLITHPLAVPEGVNARIS